MVNTEIRLILSFVAEDGEALYSQQTRPGADCGSDHQLLIVKCRLKLKKVGKTTRPFRYDLNEIQKNIYFCFIDYAKAFDCVDHNKLWKILKEMGYQSTLPVC